MTFTYSLQSRELWPLSSLFKEIRAFKEASHCGPFFFGSAPLKRPSLASASRSVSTACMQLKASLNAGEVGSNSPPLLQHGDREETRASKTSLSLPTLQKLGGDNVLSSSVEAVPHVGFFSNFLPRKSQKNAFFGGAEKSEVWKRGWREGVGDKQTLQKRGLTLWPLKV